MKINPQDFRVPKGGKFKLQKWPTRSKPLYRSEKDYKDHLAADVRELSALQPLLYASNSYSLLLIFQAMDAAGKDGAISHVLTGINPQGCEVHSFKHPSAEELQHDFLWRTTIRLPARGRIGVFNRSYYEEVLIVRVHPEILASEGVPGETDPKRMDWEKRFRSIVDFEKHLHRNGTRVLKFFLHLSKEEQRKRFLKRIDEPEKNWKFSQADMVERKYWDRYMDAYEDCLRATSTKSAPWHVVPADDKYNTRLIVSRIVIDAVKSLSLSYPKITPAHRRELLAIRKQLSRA
jgi:PPK2 family polyphosphate:nucleotide phosphotransferase